MLLDYPPAAHMMTVFGACQDEELLKNAMYYIEVFIRREMCIRDRNTSNDLLWLCKCFIVWIDDNLCQNCADRFVDPSGDKLSTDGVLKVIADITLAHGGTYGHWCKCIIRMCLTEFIHCGVDHPYLRTVAVGAVSYTHLDVYKRQL